MGNTEKDSNFSHLNILIVHFDEKERRWLTLITKCGNNIHARASGWLPCELINIRIKEKEWQFAMRVVPCRRPFFFFDLCALPFWLWQLARYTCPPNLWNVGATLSVSGVDAWDGLFYLLSFRDIPISFRIFCARVVQASTMGCVQYFFTGSSQLSGMESNRKIPEAES